MGVGQDVGATKGYHYMALPRETGRNIIFISGVRKKRTPEGLIWTISYSEGGNSRVVYADLVQVSKKKEGTGKVSDW